MSTTLVRPKGQMHILSREGDTLHEWDSSDEMQTTQARATFYEMLSKGYKAYRTKTEEVKTGEPLAEFDPQAERIIFTPPVQGGYPTDPNV